MNPVSATSPLLRFAAKPGATRRLFCVPFAGGGASAFRPWSLEAPGTVDVAVIQLPGRENRFGERALTSVTAMVDHIVSAVAQHSDLPFAVFGHSIGGLIGFELTHALRREGLPGPQHLFISATRAPRELDAAAPLHHLSDSALVAEINRRYGGIPAEILAHQDLLDLLLPTLRADITALETYKPGTHAPLNCPITVFVGDRDPRVPRATVNAWRAETTAAFDVHELEGDHFFLKAQRPAMLRTIVAALTPTDARDVA